MSDGTPKLFIHIGLIPHYFIRSCYFWFIYIRNRKRRRTM